MKAADSENKGRSPADGVGPIRSKGRGCGRSVREVYTYARALCAAVLILRCVLKETTRRVDLLNNFVVPDD